jgi:hypothetical protein
MATESCPREASVLATLRAGSQDAELLAHVQECSICMEISEASGQIRNLGRLPNVPALPDPDRLWVLARISARQDDAVRALRTRTLHGILSFGLLSAGLAWVFMEWTGIEGLDLDHWAQTIGSQVPSPIANVAVSALGALGIAVAIAALNFGRPLIARRLRYVGLM